MSDLLDRVWQQMQRDLALLKARIDKVEVRSERAETAGGVASSLLADAPLTADGAGQGDLLWISDGRKSGEGAGAGTGVLAVFNPATGTWLNVADYSAVVT